MKTALHPLSSTIAPPAEFTYPFCYIPHPLCRLAAQRVRRYLRSHSELEEEAEKGKMFGVLVVADDQGRLGFLAAYSGMLGKRNDWPWFVPAVCNMQTTDHTYKIVEENIELQSKCISTWENSFALRHARSILAQAEHDRDEAIDAWRRRMTEAKARRDQLRTRQLSDDQLSALTRESQHMKAELRRTKQQHAAIVGKAQAEVDEWLDAIAQLRQIRHRMSEMLQTWLFRHYVVLNARGEQRNLVDIFQEATHQLPPSGAGDCCAPKLLQSAYAEHLRPLAMAEFWIGESPQGDVRHDGQYYPACRGKCLPILTFMLEGLHVEPNPLATPSGKTISIAYEDDDVAVVVKPEGLLSVPGRENDESVQTIARRRWPTATGPLIVHRLDMSTSGLMIIAKTAAAYHDLQDQFLHHEVKKTYLALLDGIPHKKRQGDIRLPLSPDLTDRPRQTVDHKNGREALTHYEVVATDGRRTLVRLMPTTGRTHQLRVHCAHAEGLACPIVGDPLYGHGGERLMLHAMRIAFRHPTSHQPMEFEAKPEGENWTFVR